MDRTHEQAVSSVVGTILMLAVTVSVFGGLSVVVLNEVRSADAPPQADLAFVADGNRAVLVHRGGEDVLLSDGFVLLNANGAELRYDLSAFAAQTADGRHWRIGETLCLSGPSPPDPLRTCLLEDVPILGATVVAGGGLVADEGERGGDAGPCPLDDNGPTVPGAWSFDPADVLSTTSGAVTVRFTATDDCAGVDEAVLPVLRYRINDGSGPAYSSAGAMASEGGGVFSGTVPAQSWNVLGGQTLQVYATGLQDTLGNVGADTAVQDEPIDAVTLITYVSAATATTGTVGALAPAQDDADSEAATLLEEAGTLQPAGTGGPSKFSGSAQAATGAPTGAANVLASDNTAAEFTVGGQAIEVSGFDLPANADAVTALTIGFEGRRDSAGGGTSPALRIDYKIGAGAYNNAPTATTITATTDTDHTRTLSGTFTVADVEAMTVRLTYSTDTNRNPFVDHVFATVTYTTAAQTTYSMDIQLDFAGVADGAGETLDLRYRTAGDTYDVQVWNGASYASRGTLSLTGAFSTFTHQLTAAEYNGGAPRIRLVDLTPSGTTAGSLQLDYARVVTV